MRIGKGLFHNKVRLVVCRKTNISAYRVKLGGEQTGLIVALCKQSFLLGEALFELHRYFFGSIDIGRELSLLRPYREGSIVTARTLVYTVILTEGAAELALDKRGQLTFESAEIVRQRIGIKV